MTSTAPRRISHRSVLELVSPLIMDASPYRPKFGPQASHRLLLWDFDVPLRREGFQWLQAGLRAGQDTEFIYSQLERFEHNDDAWVLERDDYEAYDSVEAFVESMFCSVDGVWVVLSASEGHSVLAAKDARFGDSLASAMGARPLEDAYALVALWQEIYESVGMPSSLRAGEPDWISALFESTLPPSIAEVARAHASAALGGTS